MSNEHSREPRPPTYAEIYRQIARRVAVKIAEKQQDHSAAFPKIVVQNT